MLFNITTWLRGLFNYQEAIPELFGEDKCYYTGCLFKGADCYTNPPEGCYYADTPIEGVPDNEEDDIPF
jgi:hypothetical protein